MDYVFDNHYINISLHTLWRFTSIFTDNIQMIVIFILLIVSFNYILNFNADQFSLSIYQKKNPHLVSANYVPSYTAGLTFFIAVAATNLFHQGKLAKEFMLQKIMKH